MNIKNEKFKMDYIIALSSIAISIAFIIVVYILYNIEINSTLRYIILFSLSLIFSFTLFFIIYKQQNQLKAEREQLITLFQHVSDGIMILDANRNIIEMNRAAKELFGEYYIPNLFCDVCEDTNGQLKICEYDKCFLNNKKLSYFELQLKKGKNDRIPVSVSTSTYQSVEQKPLTIVSIRDLSEYRAGEQNRLHNMITASMIKAQEEERKRLSRELHDGIGQSIFSVQLGLEYSISFINDSNISEYLDNLRKTTKQTLEEIRHMAVELRPSVLDDLGLIAAIKSYIKTYGDTFGIQVNFEYSGNKKRLHSTMETTLYRIVQEAFTNVAKYADSERVDLSMSRNGEEFVLRITDYGKGFSMDDIRKKEKGVGLYSMEERTAMLNGSFHVTSQLGKGTEILVRIPIEKEDKNEERD